MFTVSKIIDDKLTKEAVSQFIDLHLAEVDSQRANIIAKNLQEVRGIGITDMGHVFRSAVEAGQGLTLNGRANILEFSRALLHADRLSDNDFVDIVVSPILSQYIRHGSMLAKHGFMVAERADPKREQIVNFLKEAILIRPNFTQSDSFRQNCPEQFDIFCPTSNSFWTDVSKYHQDLLTIVSSAKIRNSQIFPQRPGFSGQAGGVSAADSFDNG